MNPIQVNNNPAAIARANNNAIDVEAIKQDAVQNGANPSGFASMFSRLGMVLAGATLAGAIGFGSIMHAGDMNTSAVTPIIQHSQQLPHEVTDLQAQSASDIASERGLPSEVTALQKQSQAETNLFQLVIPHADKVKASLDAGKNIQGRMVINATGVMKQIGNDIAKLANHEFDSKHGLENSTAKLLGVEAPKHTVERRAYVDSRVNDFNGLARALETQGVAATVHPNKDGSGYDMDRAASDAEKTIERVISLNINAGSHTGVIGITGAHIDMDKALVVNQNQTIQQALEASGAHMQDMAME